MVEISDCNERCFGYIRGECIITTMNANCSPQCPFYKPEGCEDWIRREVNGEIWIIPPEEYAPYAEKKNRFGK